MPSQSINDVTLERQTAREEYIKDIEIFFYDNERGETRD